MATASIAIIYCLPLENKPRLHKIIAFAIYLIVSSTVIIPIKREKEEENERMRLVEMAISAFQKENPGKEPTPKDLVPYLTETQHVTAHTAIGAIDVTATLAKTKKN